MANDLLSRFHAMRVAVDGFVWHLNLATYGDHRELCGQLDDMLEVPHMVLHALGTHYASRLEIANKDHAMAIVVVGEVFKLTGEMAMMYEPDGNREASEGAGAARTNGEDDTVH